MILSQIDLTILYILIFLVLVILFILIIPFSYSVFLNIYNTDINGIITVKWLKGSIGAKIILEEKCFQIFFLRKLFSKISIKDEKKFDKSIKVKKQRKKKRRKKTKTKSI